MKRLLIAVLLALAGAGGIAFYYWQQATKLPEWYSENQSESVQPNQSDVSSSTANSATPDSTTAEAHQDRAGDRAQSTTQPSPSSKLSSRTPSSMATANKPPSQLHQNELAQRFTTEVTRKVESKKLGNALKGANTTMQNGTVESGAVVNLGGISPDQLPPDERVFYSKLIAAFPELSHQNFYIGVEGKPLVKNGQVQLDDDIRIKLGNLRFTPAQLSKRLGIPEQQIRQQLKLQVQLGNLNVDDLRLAENRLAAPKSSN